MTIEVPSIPTGLDPQTRNFFSAIREAVNQYTLNGGLNGGASSLNSNLTADNLTGINDSLDKLLNTTIPPIPTGFVVQSMRVNNFLTWDNPNYDFYNFVEIWRKPAALDASLMVTGTLYTITTYGTINWSAIGAASVAINTLAAGHEYAITTIGTVNWSSIGLIGDAVIGAVFTKNTATATGSGAAISASFTRNSTAITGSGTVKYAPNFTNAVIVGTSNGHIYVDSIAPGAVYAYWIRFISNANIAGPYNANNGTLGVISGDTQENIYGINAWIASADILNGSITNAKIGNTIESENYNGTTAGWQLSKSGGTVNLNQLTIRDAAGNIILSSGTGIPWSSINGTGTPQSGATRNVFQGNWGISHAYIIGDIVLDTLGYGWSCILGHTSGATTTTGILVPVYTIGGTNSNTYWTLYAVKGIDAVSVILSNDTHVFPATALGVPTYTGSGTTINVYDGSREVIYDGLGTSNGTWTVTGVGTNIAVSTKVDSGNYVTYPDMSSGVDSNIDASKIIYTITGISYNGTAFTITAQQSFAKSKAGATGSASASAAAFAISNSGSIFVKNASGTVLPSAGIAITTYSQNISAQTYQWYKNGTAISGATSGSYTIPTTDYASLTTNTYKCIITGTVASVSGQTLEDSITVPLIIDGSSSPAVVVSNETSNFPAPTIGYSGIIFTGGNCDITAYIGTTRLAYATTGANTFSCTNASVSNCTVATGTGTSYTYSVIAPTAMTSDTGYNDVIITIRDGAGTALSTLTKRINYSLSRAGVNAAYVILTSEQAFKFVAGSAAPTVTTITLTAALFGGLTTYEWDYWNGTAWTILSGTATSSTYSLAYNNAAFTGNSLRVRCISGTSYDEATIVKLYDGATGINAINGFLTNETCTVPTLSDGTGAAYTSAGGTFKVFSGTTEVTTSCTFSTSATVSGLTLAIGAATGIYSLSGTWTSDTASFTLTAVYSGTTLTKVYTITKAKAGTAGVNAISATLSNSDQTIPTDSLGNNGIFTGCATTMSVYIGSTDDSANWTYAVTKSTGVTCTEATSSRTQTVTSMTTDTGTVTLVASKSGFATQTEVFTLSKAKSGVAYQIILSNSAIKKTIAGVLTPTTLVLTANRLDSSGVSAYSGRFKIYLNSSTTATYTSVADLATYTYTVGSTDTTIKCELYLAGGTTTLIDTQTIPVIADGATGATGATGLTGLTGSAGTNGTNGASLYTWLKYADTTTTGMSDLPTGKTYMGVAYNKTSVTESTTYTDYDWSLIKGTDGIAGVNGTNTYTWVKYGTSAVGAGINDSPTGMTYIGLAFNKTTATESVVATDYAWSLIQGATGATGTAGTAGAAGAQGPTVQITTNRTATFVSNDNVLAASQSNIVFTATTSGITPASYAWTFYADGSTSAISSTTLGAALSGTPTGQICTLTQAQFSGAATGIKSLKVVCIVNGVAAYIDEITIVRLDNSTAAPGATVGGELNSTYSIAIPALIPAMTVSTTPACTYAAGTGNLVSGATAVADWGSYGAYSTAGLTGGISATFTIGAINGNYMVGLNTDPATDHGYSSIDYALYVNSGGTYVVFVSGIAKAIIGTCAVNDVFAIIYDGATTVNYYRNGANFYAINLTAAITSVVYVDTAIHEANTTIYGLRGGTYYAPTLLKAGNITGTINPANVSTYIANAAIQTAQIGDLAVDTLQIAGNAITVPLAAYTAATTNYGTLQTLAVPIISSTIATKLNVSFGSTYWGTSTGVGGQPYGVYSYLYANGVLIYAGGWGITDTWTATANSATILYTLPANTAVTFVMTGEGSDYTCRFITVMTVKR